MLRILRTPQSIEDLANLWSFIADDNPEAADQLLRDIESALALISSTPDLGFKLDQIGSEIRCKPVRRNYLVFYQTCEDEIHLLRVLHSSRKFEGLL